jgi:hypothetical protein
VTIREVARESGVSVASVSRVMNEKGPVREETRLRIRRAIEKLRYAPHGAARSLITRKTHNLGVLLPDLFGEFFSELIRGIDVGRAAQAPPPRLRLPRRPCRDPSRDPRSRGRLIAFSSADARFRGEPPAGFLSCS